MSKGNNVVNFKTEAKKVNVTLATEITPEAIEQRRELYNAVMKNLSIIETDNEGNPIMASHCLPLSLCYVDERYQRERTESEITRFVSHWNPALLAPILVVPHPEECRFSVVDGGKRTLTAPLVGKDSLASNIVLNIIGNDAERVEKEAELFIAQDLETDKVKAVQKHPARVLLKEEAALLLDEVTQKYNVAYCFGKGQRAQAVLGSYPEAYSTAKVHKRACLEFIFEVIHEAGWDCSVNGYASYVMRTLKNIWLAHASETVEVKACLTKELRSIEPEKFKACAIAKYPKRDFRAACTLHCEEMIAKALKTPRKIYLKDDKMVIEQAESVA